MIDEDDFVWIGFWSMSQVEPQVTCKEMSLQLLWSLLQTLPELSQDRLSVPNANFASEGSIFVIEHVMEELCYFYK